jgi:membrane protease subunit HflC
LRFHESAVLVTFGKVTTGLPNAKGEDAGLHWQWPWPIQRVRKYDARVQMVEDRLEQQETRDKHVVILSTYLAWRVSDPTAFYRALRTEENARSFLRDRLSTARGEISKFSLDELTTTDPERQRLAQAEAAITARMREDLEGAGYGLTLQGVGIRRIILPKSICKTVFNRMRETRQRLAQTTRSEGMGIARRIRSEANSDRRRILSFADRLAHSIRAEGEAAAARYYELFQANEEFAVFLRKIEALKAMLARNTTFVLDTNISPLNLLESGMQHQGSRPLMDGTVVQPADGNGTAQPAALDDRP